MANNILEKIIKKKIEKIEKLKQCTDLTHLKELIDKNNKYYDFKETIQKNLNKDKFSIIAEIKQASPSAGIIINNYDPVSIANIYNTNKATCLSVLTEEDFFFRKNRTHIRNKTKN